MSEPRLYPGTGPDERTSFAPYSAFDIPADLRELHGRYDVEATARRVRNFRYAEEWMMMMMGGWIATIPELPVKTGLGKIVWEYCGMARNEAGLQTALSEIPALREDFRKNVKVLGSPDGINTMREKVNRVDDFMEFAELKVRDALHRRESCGGHFREESQTPEGEALRDDENFAYVGAWEWNGADTEPTVHKEELNFENVALTQRSYK